MKAVGYFECLPISDSSSLLDLEIPKPSIGTRDILVRIRAVSINPLDAKVRTRRCGTPGHPIILGWDAAGVVEEVGTDVTLFKPGDEVYYAGDINRQGSNAEFGVVDERIVAHKPRSLTFEQAAALPLTSITAWEALFDRLGVSPSQDQHEGFVLIVGGGGGVGSMAIQLARQLTSLTVVSTASRSQTIEWARHMGAHHVVDHNRPLSGELSKLGIAEVPYVFSTTQTDQHWDDIVTVLSPQGHVCLIDDPASIDVMKLKPKAGSLHIEMMFARPVFGTKDMGKQGELLGAVASLVDEGRIKTTLKSVYGPIDAATVRRAHELVESGRAVGKIVLSGIA